MAIIWLVLGVVLLLVELRHLAFYALFAAVGSLVAAGVALIAPSTVPLQVGVAVVVAAAGVVAVRPAMSRAFPRHVGGHVARGVHGGIVGQEALTLDDVGPPHRRGHVRLTGERWLAISGEGGTIPADTRVVVTAVEGTTLIVLPIDGPHPGLGEGGHVEAGSSDRVPPNGADGRSS